MTGGQSSLGLGYENQDEAANLIIIEKISSDRPPLRVISAAEDELAAHTQRLQQIQKASGNKCVWLALEAPTVQ